MMNAASQPQRGFVLVVTLWVLAISSVLVLGFGRRAFLEARAAGYSVDETQARMMARAAVNRGIIELRNKFYKDRMLEETTQELASTHLGQPWAQVMALHEEGGFFDLGESAGTDGVWLKIEDAESRININTAPEALLEEVEGVSRGLMRTISRRRVEETEKGNMVHFHELEEMRYLRDMKEEDWFGTEDQPPLRDLFTVWGGPSINVNTASREVLACIPNLEDSAIDAIVDYRGDGEAAEAALGFSSAAQLEQETGIRGDSLNAINQFCSFQSNFFIIRGIATRQGGKVRVECRAVVNAQGEAATILDWQEVTVGV